MNIIKNIILTVITLVLTLILFACAPKKVEETVKKFGETVNIIFKEKTIETISDLRKSNQSLLSTYKLNSSSTDRYYLGDSPEIYFEYERNVQFIFLEAGIETSSDPGKIFKFNDSNSNLDGYKIIAGQYWDGKTDKFRAIITVPEVSNFGQEKYTLKSIKISVDNIVIDVEIDETYFTEFNVDKEKHWNIIENYILNYKIQEEAVRTIGFDNFNLPFNVHSLIITDDNLEKSRINENYYKVDSIGDSEFNFTIQTNFEGEIREYSRTVDFKDIWTYDFTKMYETPIGTAKVFNVEKSFITKAIYINFEEYYTKQEIVINRKINGESIEYILPGVPSNDNKEPTLRLRGFTIEEAKKAITFDNRLFYNRDTFTGLIKVYFDDETEPLLMYENKEIIYEKNKYN